MAKATIEFNLDDREDVKAHLRCVKSTSMAVTLWDIDQHLRNEAKYKDNEVAEKLREEIREIMDDNGINLDELID
jgi:hypothetical protein